jgi:hypothetical protein
LAESADHSRISTSRPATAATALCANARTRGFGPLARSQAGALRGAGSALAAGGAASVTTGSVAFIGASGDVAMGKAITLAMAYTLRANDAA